MSVINVHHDEFADSPVVLRALGWLGAAVRAMHQAIITAKMERLENELVVRRGYRDEKFAGFDATRYPQQPLVLSDKWDF